MKKFFKYFFIFLFIGAIYFGYGEFQKFVLLSGASAKWVASGMFVADRSQESIEGTDTNFYPVNLGTNELDFDKKSVTTKVFGLKKRVAVYREGLGSVIINDTYDPNEPYLKPNRNQTPKDLPFPYGNLPQKDTIFSNVDYAKLKGIIDNYFDENSAVNTTRSFLIVYKNQIIVEKYSDGFDANSLHLGWSMGKSLTSTMFGVLESQGKIDVNQPAPIDDWAGDERSKITTNNLLQMNSGLAWEEDYTKISDVTKMLFFETDMTKSQVNKPLTGKPNESWNYSSGTTNLLSGILRQKYATHQEYLDAWYSDFIDKIGMHSMVVEADLAGNYVGSSYAWANTRDWAKYGLLYLNKGTWKGEEIFSENWVEYTTTATNSSEGLYGAQFWLNSGGHLPDVPRDMYLADGYQGQRVFIIPSKELVIVRLGVTYSNIKDLLKERPVKKGENQDIIEFELNHIRYNKLLKDIISTIE